MPTEFKPDPYATDYVEGVSRTYYQDQVQQNHSAFDDEFEFKLAAAHAKDQARHKLIRAMQDKAKEFRLNQGRLQDLEGFLSGNRFNENEKRTVDGVEGAPDDAIKL